jgi:cytidine deaminase
MNIIKNSLQISLSLLPKAKSSRNSRNKFFHFAYAYRKNKLLAIGQNNPDKTHTQAFRIANRFNTDSKYPYLHAETDLISRIWGKHYIDSSLKIVLVRLNKHGELRNSKPCIKCQQILNALEIDKVYWSINNGFHKE